MAEYKLEVDFCWDIYFIEVPKLTSASLLPFTDFNKVLPAFRPHCETLAILALLSAIQVTLKCTKEEAGFFVWALI